MGAESSKASPVKEDGLSEKSRRKKPQSTSSTSLHSTSSEASGIDENEICCLGHLVFRNGSIFEGHICSRIGLHPATFLTPDGECVKGTWKLLRLKYHYDDAGWGSPIAIYSCNLKVLTLNQGHVTYNGPVVIVLQTGDLRLPNNPTLLKQEQIEYESKCGVENEVLPTGQIKQISDKSAGARTVYSKFLAPDSSPSPEFRRSASLVADDQLILPSHMKSETKPAKNVKSDKKAPTPLELDGALPYLNRPATTRHKKPDKNIRRDYRLMFWSLCGKYMSSRTRWDEEIEKDLNRTQFTLFDKASVNIVRAQIGEVLKFIALSFPRIGYCQGMDYLVKYILLFYAEPKRVKNGTKGKIHSSTGVSQLDDRVITRQTESTFVFFSQLLEDEQYRMSDLFSPGFTLLHALLNELNSRLSKVEPVLHAHLLEHLVTPTLYATKWFLTIFAFYIDQDPDSVNNVWLRFLSQGWDAVIDVAVACVVCIKELLLNADLEECLHVLSGKSDFTEGGMLARVFSSDRGQAILLNASKYRRGSEFFARMSRQGFHEGSRRNTIE